MRSACKPLPPGCLPQVWAVQLGQRCGWVWFIETGQSEGEHHVWVDLHARGAQVAASGCEVDGEAGVDEELLGPGVPPGGVPLLVRKLPVVLGKWREDLVAHELEQLDRGAGL